jgi:hypothetical protein
LLRLTNEQAAGDQAEIEKRMPRGALPDHE